MLRRTHALAIITMLTATACGGGGTTTGPTVTSVSRVTIAPAGDITLDIGATAQLAATTLSSTGAVLTGKTVTWTSSDATIATVTGNSDGTASTRGVKGGTATLTA